MPLSALLDVVGASCPVFVFGGYFCFCLLSGRGSFSLAASQCGQERELTDAKDDFGRIVSHSIQHIVDTSCRKERSSVREETPGRQLDGSSWGIHLTSPPPSL